MLRRLFFNLIIKCKQQRLNFIGKMLFSLPFILFFSSGIAMPPLSIIDPRVLAIAIQDNNEPLVNLKKAGGLCIGPSPEIPNNQDYYYLRATVYKKLIEAQNKLPENLKFCLYEGYRSRNLQQQLFQNRLEKIKKLHPAWSYTHQFIETTRLVSPVINLNGSKNIPPHTTGSAFDIYLIDKNNQVVDMGIHPKDWMMDNDGAISQTDSKIISITAQRHREIMNQVLSLVGFANYPGEYWHWSYGDRYWAYVTNHPNAIYGSVSK